MHGSTGVCLCVYACIHTCIHTHTPHIFFTCLLQLPQTPRHIRTVLHQTLRLRRPNGFFSTMGMLTHSGYCCLSVSFQRGRVTAALDSITMLGSTPWFLLARMLVVCTWHLATQNLMWRLCSWDFGMFYLCVWMCISVYTQITRTWTHVIWNAALGFEVRWKQLIKASQHDQHCSTRFRQQ